MKLKRSKVDGKLYAVYKNEYEAERSWIGRLFKFPLVCFDGYFNAIKLF